MASISSAAPQFLVSDLNNALAFYEERLGFHRDFVYEAFYASVSRDGATIHLKCAPKLDEERAHRRSGEHLDAYLGVSGVRQLHDELVGRGAAIVKSLKERPWGHARLLCRGSGRLHPVLLGRRLSRRSAS